MKLKLHATLKSSLANGPGRRFVVWFQGCPINCPDCFNPETHSLHAGLDSSTESVIEQVRLQQKNIQGITVSGGEPFAQPAALADLVQQTAVLKLSVLIFSGYTLENIQKNPAADTILHHTDVLIAGPYRSRNHYGHSMLGSSNQKIHLMSNRYRREELEDIPASEIQISADGGVIISGIAPPKPFSQKKLLK